MLVCRRLFALFVFAAYSLCFANAEPALPEGLSTSDWAQIQQQIEAQRFTAQPQNNGSWRATNPTHGFRIDYQADGQTVLSAASHAIALKLTGYGYGDTLIGLDPMPALSSNGNTVTYQWKPGLREWWTNSPRGVEQWFELAERPAVAKDHQPLVVAMTLDTQFNVEIDDNALKLTSPDRSTVITYDRLKVWDANGNILPARMHWTQNQLALHVDDTDATYPVTIDPTFAQQAYLKAFNSDENDNFGHTVAVSGDTVVVGAFLEDSNATGINGDETNNLAFDSGAAYVFVRSGSSWVQQAYLKASNSEQGDQFGYSVAVSGDTVVVGARFEDSDSDVIGIGQDDNSVVFAGAAYVFVRNGAGVWSQQAYLKASNSDEGDLFGSAVAISSDTVVVGAPGESSGADDINGNQADNSVGDAGAAYVFVRNGAGVWSQQAYLKAFNSRAIDLFGFSVAVSDDTVVVGARFENSDSDVINAGEDNNLAPDAGAAYVFARSGTSWTQQAYLKAFNSDGGDFFGSSVGVSDDTVVVGAPGESSDPDIGDEDDNSAADAGASYVFVRDGSGIWSQQAYLKSTNSDAGDEFGHSVGISGDTLVIGAYLEDGDPDIGGQDDNSADEAGAAYVFVRDGGGGWDQQAYLKASNAEASDRFGSSSAISGDTLVVGAIFEDSDADSVDGDETDNSASGAGAAYVFGVIPTFTVGGTVSGLAGTGLLLQNNAGPALAVSANGAFAFSAGLADGAAYNVTVLSQPSNPNQTCTVANGTGTISGADVTNVEVTCATGTFTVGGTVTGLVATGLILQNNGGDDLAISADGAFTFLTALADGASYDVTVLSQPVKPNQTCTVANGTGTVTGANVTNVEVTCVTGTFTVGGTVSGLTGTGLVLQNNGGDDLAISANGPFIFASALADGTSYELTVLTQPSNPDQTCTVTGGIGTISGANVTDVTISCADTADFDPLVVPTLSMAGLIALILLSLIIGIFALRSTV